MNCEDGSSIFHAIVGKVTVDELRILAEADEMKLGLCGREIEEWTFTIFARRASLTDFRL
jgi:hypothetical protein